MTLGRASRTGLTTGLALALALAGCSATPSTLVVSGTVEKRVVTVAVPSVSVPAVNLDAGFATLTGTRNPVTGRTGTNLSTVATTYGFGTFVRLTEVTVAVGDTVTAGQSLGRIDDAALTAQVAVAKADQEAALAQIGLLGDAIDTTYDKQSDVKDAKATVLDAIKKVTAVRATLLKARAKITKGLPKARAALAQINATIAALPPGVPVPPALQKAKGDLEKIIAQGVAGLRKINAALPKLAAGLRKARSGLRKLEDATVKITEARGTLRDLKDLAAIQADALKVPVDLARTQVVLAGLTSPVNGVVVTAATSGSVVAPGATAVSIRETRPSTVTAWLASDQVAQVCEGDAASIIGDWMTGDGVPATLTRIGTRSDYPPTSVATDEVHLTRAVEVEFTATEQLPAGVPVELHINSCHPAASNSNTDR